MRSYPFLLIYIQSHQSPIQIKIIMQLDQGFREIQFNDGDYVHFQHSSNRRINIKFKIIPDNFKRRKPRFSYQYIELEQEYQYGSLRWWLRRQVKKSYYYIVKSQLFYNMINLINPNGQEVIQYIKNSIQKFRCDSNNVIYQGKNLAMQQPDYKFQNDSFSILIQALGAAKIIELIKMNNFSQIIQKIQNFWKDQMELRWNHKLTQEESEYLSRAQKIAKEKFKGMFSFSETEYSYFYNPKVFDQHRFKQASLRDNRFVFHITRTTQQIFNVMNIRDAQQYSNSIHHMFLHGLGGIGKSISTSLLVELHNYVDKLRYHFSEDQYTTIVEDPSISWETIKNYPKYFYFSIDREYNWLRFNLTIKQQLPYELQIEIIPDYNLVMAIKHKYEEKNIRPIYIIDQINILCSLSRQMKEYNKMYQMSNKHSIDQIKQILNNLRNQDVVFNSSQNAQIRELKNILWDTKIIMRKINYQAIAFNQADTQEKFSIIWFQYLNQMALKRISPQEINHALKNMEEISNKINNNYFQDDFFYLFELTHLRIKKSIEQMFLQNRRIININNFQSYFVQIHKISTHILKRKYQSFLTKGKQEQLYKKFMLICELMKAAARQAEDQSNINNYFTVDLKQDISEQSKEYLFKELAEVVDKRRIQIYLSPHTFLNITSFAIDKLSLTLRYARQLLKNYVFDGVLIGRMLDSTYIKLLQMPGVMIIAVKRLFNINNCSREYEGFIGFSSILTKKQRDTKQIQEKQIQISQKNSVYMRFCKIFKIFDQNRDQLRQNVFLSAVPKDINELYKTNSQCIDFLLIQHNIDFSSRRQFFQQRIKAWGRNTNSSNYRDQYNLYTFDFCVSFDKNYINKKIQRAKLFFQKFDLICYMENLQHENTVVNDLIRGLNQRFNVKLPQKKVNYVFKNIVHTFLVPQKMCTQYRNNIESNLRYTNIVFQFYPLQKIQFKRENSQTNSIYTLLSDIIRALNQCIQYREGIIPLEIEQ